ncbi:MAG: hypothetical protein IJ600_09940, partial [Lachnospiraceae bacterium]|nr:hypothetical protein [Lachnospiraceae bacterium]
DMAMIVASYGKDYKKIAHVSMWLAGIVMLLTVSSYFLGILPERTLERDGMVRHSFGTLGPTNLAGHVGFIIMTYFFVKDGKVKWMAYLVVGILSVLNLLFVDGRTSFLSVFLIVVGSLIYQLWQKKKWPVPEPAMKLWKYLLAASFVICAGLFMILVFTYTTNPAVFYNRFHVLESFAGRIGNPNRIMGKTGLSLFGNYYEHYWVAGNVFKQTGNYEFLDSSYARVILMYGIVAFVLILWLLTRV